MEKGGAQGVAEPLARPNRSTSSPPYTWTGLVESVAITVIGANLVDKILTAVIVWLLLRQLPIRTTRHFPAMAAVR